MDYVMGSCFRCDRDGIQVTHIGHLTGEEGAETPISACQPCVERLGHMHERALLTLIRPRTSRVLTP